MGGGGRANTGQSGGDVAGSDVSGNLYREPVGRDRQRSVCAVEEVGEISAGARERDRRVSCNT